MNLRSTLPLLVACLVSPVSFADTAHLVNSTFETPTNLVVTYPPAAGEKFQNIAPGLSGWAQDGSLQMCYGTTFGVEGGGGIQAKILKTAKFTQISYDKLDFSAFRDDYKLRDVVRSVRASFDANIPEGHEFVVYMRAETPKDLGLSESQWTTRLVLGKVVGEGRYAHYTFSGDAVDGKVQLSFINYVRGLYLNGLPKLSGSLVLHLDPSQWPEGKEFMIDNVKLTIETR